MAGFRLAPVAARRRRNPWQRRRLSVSAPVAAAGVVSDGFSITDGQWYGFGGWYVVSFTASYNKTVADGFTISDSVGGAGSSSGTATGGLIFLFNQGTAGSAYTRTASDGFTVADSVSGSLVPVATSSYSRTATDGFTVADSASGSLVAAGASSTLVGVDLEFTALLETELVFVGE